MAAVNKAIIVGNLGKDPEIRYTPNGTAVATFSVATTERLGQDREERTEWHRIVAFGRLAEICGEYLAKGRQVYIEGRIQTRDWEDRDGVKRYTTEIVANTMQMLGPPPSGASRGDYQRGGGGNYQRGPGDQNRGGQTGNSYSGGGRQNDYNSGYEPPAGDDDIPF